MKATTTQYPVAGVALAPGIHARGVEGDLKLVRKRRRNRKIFSDCPDANKTTHRGCWPSQTDAHPPRPQSILGEQRRPHAGSM